MNLLVKAAASLALLFVFVAPLQAAELVMVEHRACSYCVKFNRELGPVYGSTAAGQIAPLRKVSPLKKWPADLAGVRPVRVTPVFIVVENGKEIGRFPGYNGEAGFWQRLNPLLAKLPNGHLAQK